MGRTARFEQIYVSNLDADPVEQETLTGIKSILTSEIEADEVVVSRLGISNTAPTKQISVGTKLFIDENDTIMFDLRERGRASRFFVDNQLGIGTTNPTKAFQVTDRVNIDLEGRDLMTVNGNLVATNVIINNSLVTSGSNLVVNGKASNVITIRGGLVATNVIATSNLDVGSNISFSDTGSNVVRINGNVFHNGYLTLVGNLEVTGNITITDTATYISQQELRVINSVIHSGFGNGVLSAETGFVMTPGTGYSNVAMGFVPGDRGREMAFFQTDSYGGDGIVEIAVDDTKVVNVHVFGDIYTSHKVGVANIYPTHDLCVGSNIFFDDTGSNVMHTSGTIYANAVTIGTGGIRVGDLLTMKPTSSTPVTINSNVQMNALRTTGTAPSGIANTAPRDTLAIGAKIFANLTAPNTLTVLGNTATTNLVTQLVFSSSNLVIHADRFGGDSTSNVLMLVAGPTTSNVSAIEVYGASTSNTHQNIRFKTKNTERVRITSDGRVGIANTNPTESLTVAGNVYVMGSNASIYGNIWGSTGNTSMRVLSTPTSGENRIENIVASGKGLNFYASKTATMGAPKMTILESSNVGIGTASPEGLLHTSGGTVFINDQVTNRNSFNHLGTPLVVTNNDTITSVDDDAPVMHLCREGVSGTNYGARATFKIGKHSIESGKSRSSLDIYLADDDYSDEIDILTLQSNGKVGIGSTIPEAYLEVVSAGIGNARRNSLMVHNHSLSPGSAGDAIMAAQTDVLTGNAFTSYIQTQDDNNPQGWSVGVSGIRDFRITRNVDRVNESTDVGLYIDGTTRDVGIGTDVPRGKLEVTGNVVIGSKLSFVGITGDEFGNTHIEERRYNTQYSKTELLLFKGNDGVSVDQGPDRIRHIAAEHVFQTYDTVGASFESILAEKDGEQNKPLIIANNGKVVIGGQSSDATATGIRDSTKLVVNGDIQFQGGGSFRLTGIAFSTTEEVNSINKIRSLLNDTTRRPITFVHEIDGDNDFEFARFDDTGNLGIGTSSIGANVHIYNSETTDQTLLRLESPGDNKETGMVIYTADGEGGYIRGFSNSENDTTGLVMGVANNSTMTNCLHLIHTSNVGVGTSKPATKFHVYDGVPRIESSTSNAMIEFKTTAGTSNIYSDTVGNIHINPVTGDHTTFIESDLEITGDLTVQGAIDLGEQVGIGLGGASANTVLHVSGGFISNADQVACKRYSQSFSIIEGASKDIQLIFGSGAFYAKVTAILRRIDGSTVIDLSTMILELQGGTSDGTASTLDVAIGTKNLFGGTNSYPWSSIVTTGVRGISMTPYNIDSQRVYAYDIYVELIGATSLNCRLQKITRGLSDVDDLDNGTGGQVEIVTFTY